MTEDTPIESGMVTRAIAKAQKKVEDRNFEIRKSLLEYDEVMNQQRREIYGTRQEVLESIGLRDKIEVMFQRTIERHARQVFLLDSVGFQGWFQRTFGFELDEKTASEATAKVGEFHPVIDLVQKQYDEREGIITVDMLRKVERYLLLKAIDDKWRDHLYAIDALKAGIGLRSYAQVDPKNEYKREGFQLFEKLLQGIEDEVTSLILRIQVQAPAAPQAPAPSAPRFVSPTAQLPKNPAMDPEATAPVEPTGVKTPVPPTPPRAQPALAAPPRTQPPAGAPTQPMRRPNVPVSVPASQAFDVARRQQAIAAAMQRQQAQQTAAASGGDGQAPSGTAASATSGAKPPVQSSSGKSSGAQSSGAQSPAAQSPAAQNSPGPRTAGQKLDFSNVSRNDACPCGSGQKFKNCHGK